MKLAYETPDIRLIYLAATDLIATSYTGDEDDEEQEEDDYTKRY
jgi:hypothetical protein